MGMGGAGREAVSAGPCFNGVLCARCLGKGQTQGKRDSAGRTQPDKPDGSDKLGRELLSSVKYSQADGNAGERGRSLGW